VEERLAEAVVCGASESLDSAGDVVETEPAGSFMSHTEKGLRLLLIEDPPAYLRLSNTSRHHLVHLDRHFLEFEVSLKYLGISFECPL
jgi:hypothetical protein